MQSSARVRHFGRPLQVLLVEDNPDDADLLRETLNEVRAQVAITSVETLREARTEIAKNGCDLILLDLSLPDSIGLDTVHAAIKAAPDVPILVLTGAHDEMLGAAAVHAGAQDYLLKGQIDALMLTHCMAYAVERQRLVAEQAEAAAVSAAIARCGEALLQSGPNEALADRLCDIAVNELHCSSSEIWVLDRSGGGFVPAAARPLRATHLALSPAAQSEAPQSSEPEPGNRQLPRDAFAAFEASTGAEEGVRWRSPELSAQLPPSLHAVRGNGDVLYLVLARGGELIGVQICAYPTPPRQRRLIERVADKFVHLATLALSNARLVAQLEHSNTIKTYFAATMSHELRATLFAIAGYSEILNDGLPEEPFGRLARVIGERAHESTQVIQAALELTRSEVRPTLPDAEVVDLRGLLEKLAGETHIPADKAALNFEWEMPEPTPALRTDAIKLTMVLKNLVANAIKFTERGRVLVAVSAAHDCVHFRVEDTGIGIEAQELPHLFEPFRQSHGSRSRRAGGTGLGLYIVNRLVALLGGSVSVQSDAGRGTRFLVTLPLSPPPAAA
jgi:signal transduction histidine kinase/DNA-binding NarL/FixJ family response regulator